MKKSFFLVLICQWSSVAFIMVVTRRHWGYMNSFLWFSRILAGKPGQRSSTSGPRLQLRPAQPAVCLTPHPHLHKKNNLQTLWNFFLYFCIITQVCFLLVGEQFQSLCKSTNPNTNHPKLSLYIINQSKYTSCCRPIKTAQIKPRFRGQPIRNCDK